MIRAIVLDFDGLIIDTETSRVDSFEAVYAAHGLPFDKALFTKEVGHSGYTFDAWAPFPANIDRAALENERSRCNLAIIEKKPLLPGVKTLLDAAKSANLRIGMASNSSHDWVQGHMRRLGLHDRIHFFACVGDTPSPKPEPDIYRFAVNQLGVRPHEAIAFEDSATGAKAARRAGLWVVAVPSESTHLHDLDSAHVKLKTLEDTTLPELCARFANGSR